MMRFTMAVLFVACLGHTAIPAPHDEQPRPFLIVPKDYLALAFTPDGKTIATTGRSINKIEFWDAATGNRLVTIEDNTVLDSWIEALAFSPDGKTFAVPKTVDGEKSGAVQLWDVKTGKPIAMVKGHAFSVLAISFSPDGSLLASADEHVRLWDIKTGKASIVLQGQPKELKPGDDFTCTVVFSSDSKLLASCNWKGDIRVWDVKTGKATSTLKVAGKSEWNGRYSRLVFDADGKTIIAASPGAKSVQRWDLTTGKVTTTAIKSEEDLTRVALSPNGKLVAAGDMKGGVFLWDITTGKQIAILSKHKNGVGVIAFSPDGRTVVSGSDEPALKFDKVPE